MSGVTRARWLTPLQAGRGRSWMAAALSSSWAVVDMKVSSWVCADILARGARSGQPGQPRHGPLQPGGGVGEVVAEAAAVAEQPEVHAAVVAEHADRQRLV